jgi:hypothetical protein
MGSMKFISDFTSSLGIGDGKTDDSGAGNAQHTDNEK